MKKNYKFQSFIHFNYRSEVHQNSIIFTRSQFYTIFSNSYAMVFREIGHTLEA